MKLLDSLGDFAEKYHRSVGMAIGFLIFTPYIAGEQIGRVIRSLSVRKQTRAFIKCEQEVSLVCDRGDDEWLNSTLKASVPVMKAALVDIKKYAEKEIKHARRMAKIGQANVEEFGEWYFLNTCIPAMEQLFKAICELVRSTSDRGRSERLRAEVVSLAEEFERHLDKKNWE